MYAASHHVMRLHLCHTECLRSGACRAISRELHRGERPRRVQYHVAVATSDVRGASTSADVYITLHGEQSSGVKLDLSGGPDVFNR